MGILGLAISVHHLMGLHFMVGRASHFPTQREAMLVGTLGAMGKRQTFSITAFGGRR